MSAPAPLFRVRCPADDGTGAHSSVDLRGRFGLVAFGRALRALTRCACGESLHMLSDDAPEPKDDPAHYAALRKRAAKGGRRG